MKKKPTTFIPVSATGTGVSAADLVTANAAKLDRSRRYSFGPRTNTTNLIDEAEKAAEITFTFTNPTASDVKVAFSTLFSDSLRGGTNSIYASVTEVLSKSQSDVVFKTTVPADPEVNFGIACNDSGRSAEQIMQFAAMNCIRLVGMSMVSKQVSTGEADISNYSKKIKSVYTSIFEDPEVTELNLRPLLKGSTYNAEILEVNFIKQNFLALLTPEHILQLTIAKNTELTVTFHFGATASPAQRMYRDLKAADNIMRQVATMTY